MVIFLINQCFILPCSTFFSTFIFHPFSSKVYISRSKEIKKSKKIFSNHFDNPSFLPIPRSRLFDQFQNPLPPKYLSNILSPRARWNEKKGNEEIKGEEKKMHKRRTNDRQDSLDEFSGVKVSTYDHDWTAQPSGSQISPHPLQLALVFSPSGWRGPRVTNWSMPHTRLCEASGLEPREIPRPITCGSQLWIN